MSIHRGKAVIPTVILLLISVVLATYRVPSINIHYFEADSLPLFFPIDLSKSNQIRILIDQLHSYSRDISVHLIGKDRLLLSGEAFNGENMNHTLMVYQINADPSLSEYPLAVVDFSNLQPIHDLTVFVFGKRFLWQKDQAFIQGE